MSASYQHLNIFIIPIQCDSFASSLNLNLAAFALFQILFWLLSWFSHRDELIGKENVRVSSVWFESWMATKAVIKIPTFQIIVLQGIVGSLPWTAMVFFTMWFELIGKYICKF